MFLQLNNLPISSLQFHNSNAQLDLLIGDLREKLNEMQAQHLEQRKRIADQEASRGRLQVNERLFGTGGVGVRGTIVRAEHMVQEQISELKIRYWYGQPCNRREQYRLRKINTWKTDSLKHNTRRELHEETTKEADSSRD